MSQAKLYALLVGINDYPEPVSPLSFCENDVDEMDAYLKSMDFEEVRIEKITGKNATKQRIVEGFLKHLSQAGAKDTALFYYSGHGTQEKADTSIWRFESDDKLECLVPYDGMMDTGSGTVYNLLADKELRYLLHKIGQSNAHVVTIFDCCHSGSVTRNSSVETTEEPVRERRIVRARMTSDSEARSWDNFIFSNDISVHDLKTKPLDDVLPAGEHIELAACEADQSAYETAGSGIFTKNLLEVLKRSKAAVNYYDLQSRVKYYIKNQFDQTPRIYAQGTKAGAIFQGFLGRSVEGRPLMANVQYNNEIGWIMDMGAMHGVSYEAETVALGDDNGKACGKAIIEKITSAYTLVTPEEDLSQDKTYSGYLDKFLSSPIKIYVDNQASIPEPMQWFEEKVEEAGKNIHVTDKKHEADYLLRVQDKNYAITQNNTAARLVTRPIKLTSKEDADELIVYLNYLSRWEFVKSLHNPKSSLFTEHPIDIEVSEHFKDGTVKPMDLSKDMMTFDYDDIRQGKRGTHIKMTLTNTFDRPLYVSFIFLSELFQIFPKLLGSDVVMLEPRKSATVLNGRLIELKMPDFIKTNNWPEVTSHFKLIVSTKSFETGLFEQAPLPAPSTRSSESKGLKLKKRKKPSADDWSTRLITLKITNPKFEE